MKSEFSVDEPRNDEWRNFEANFLKIKKNVRHIGSAILNFQNLISDLKSASSKTAIALK